MNKKLPITTESTKEKGFTLAELLIVIAIIAILAVIGLTLFGSTQQDARDARRRSDIDAIANALESAKSSNPTYQALVDAKFAGGKVPTDAGNSSAAYSICYTTVSGTTIVSPGATLTWANTSAGPTNPTCVGAGLSGWVTVANGTPPTGVYSWTICALLEKAGSVPYCKGNAQ